MLKENANSIFPNWKTFSDLTKIAETRYNKGKLEMRFSTFSVNEGRCMNTGIQAYSCEKRERHSRE